MENAENKRIKIIYIGSTPETFNRFEKSGKFEILQLDTSVEAMNHLRSNKSIQAVIAEARLPGLDGVDAYKFLIGHNACTNIPYIVISHKDEIELQRKAFEQDIYDYYQAPINIERIYKRILYFKTHTEIVPPPKTPDNPPYKTPFIKRLFDVILAGSALLFLSPLLLVVIIAIKLESKGSFYYISKRVGANFKIFGFYKLRSMRTGADKLQKELSHLNQYAKKEVEEVCTECAKLPEGKYCSDTHIDKNGETICERIHIMRKNSEAAFLKLENDPRITRVGKFIRNTSIDELPQLINIIKGDMSIVGNRPLPVDEANMLSMDRAGKRFAAAAGLTGLWQVELRGRGGNMSEEERFDLDVEYAENNSFMGDMKLIYRTFKIFIQPGNV